MSEEAVYPSVSVVGVPVARYSMAELVETIIAWMETPEPKVAIGVNAHVCNLAARDASFRQKVLDAELAYADGQVIVWAAKALGSSIAERTATTDLIYPLAAECARRQKRVYLFGGAPGVAQLAGQRLVEHAPGLLFRSHVGDVSAGSAEALIADISSFKPDLLLVGLGDPLQQDWIASQRQALSVPAILTCGGLFDWVSGGHRRAPAWMIKTGLEWLWRLMLEPRRLAARYLVGNPIFLARLGAQLARVRIMGRTA